MYSQRNSLILIYRFNSKCDQIYDTREFPVILDVYILRLTIDNRTVALATSFCGRCSKKYKSRRLSMTLPTLTQLKSNSAAVRAESVQPTIAVLATDSGTIFDSEVSTRCDWLYKKRASTRSDFVSCAVGHIFMENAAAMPSTT